MISFMESLINSLVPFVDPIQFDAPFQFVNSIQFAANSEQETAARHAAAAPSLCCTRAAALNAN